MGIDRRESLIVAAMAAFGIVWVGVFVPVLEGQPWFLDAPPILAYPLYNVGFILLTVALFGIPASYAVKREVDVEGLIRGGFAAWISFSLVLDMLEPPFFLAPNGNFAIPLGTNALENTAVDAAFWQAWSWLPNIQFTLPFVGTLGLWFLMVYAVTPVLGLVLAALLLKPREFLRLVGLD